MMHPLINKTSTHYDAEEKTAIQEMEEFMTIQELISACRFNIYKYQYRKNYKGAKVDDEAKIQTYQDYFVFLNSINYAYHNSVAKNAYKALDIKMEYR